MEFQAMLKEAKRAIAERDSNKEETQNLVSESYEIGE